MTEPKNNEYTDVTEKTIYKHLEICDNIPQYDGDGNIASFRKHRKVIMCGDWEGAEKENLTETAKIWWTDARVEAYQALLAEQAEATHAED